MSKCEYPNCKLNSTHTWGLVPLCEYHHEIIKDETEYHYQNPQKFFNEDREHYFKIADKIPWSRKD